MTLEEFIEKQTELHSRFDKLYNNANYTSSFTQDQNFFELPQETLDTMHESIADPTGLKPFMNEQIEQYDILIKQMDMLQASLQEQFAFIKQEQTDRIEGDIANMKYAKIWNRRNFIISSAAMLFAFGGFVISLLEHFGL